MTETGNSKHDVFIGNLTYNCTEDQLNQMFSTVGKINEIRMVMDRNTNKPKGYAFVEYDDAQTALSAIRNLDGAELNNRKLRVSYTANGGIKELAMKTGQLDADGNIIGSATANAAQAQAQAAVHAVASQLSRTSNNNTQNIPQNLTTHLQLHEAYDILAKMKDLLSEDRGHRARELLEAHPQLVGAFAEILSRFGLSRGKF